MTRGARAFVACSLAAVVAAAWSAAPTNKTATATGKVAGAPAAAPSTPAAASTPHAAPVEFTGTFAAGTTYVGEMYYDKQVLKTWRPVKEVQPGPNVAWTVVWSNLDQFPALKTPAGQARNQRFRFRVAKSDVVSGSPQLPWMATYHCEVLGAEPVAASPQQQQHKQQQAPRRH